MGSVLYVAKMGPTTLFTVMSVVNWKRVERDVQELSTLVSIELISFSKRNRYDKSEVNRLFVKV